MPGGMGSLRRVEGFRAMSFRPARSVRRVRSLLRAHLMGSQILAFLPAVTLASYWIGGQTALLLVALIVPGIFAFGGMFDRAANRPDALLDGITNLPHRMTVVHALDVALPDALTRGRAAAAMAAAIDNFDDATRDLGPDEREEVLKRVADRLKQSLRETDKVARVDGARFAIGLTGLRRADHPTMFEIAQRMQIAVSEPISISGQRVHLTLSVGFCLPGKIDRATGDTIVEAAEAALASARGQGGGAVRSFDPDMPNVTDADRLAVEELTAAMESGEIQPWFQPQVANKSGAVIGFEALARWNHPERGIVMPADFLPLIDPAGLSRRLGEVMLYGAFLMLRGLDRQGLHVPQVSVNFSHAELSAPDLADRIKWELDRFDLAPDRLAIEVLETAIARDTVAVERNLRSLAELGCSIDLDDFGTGNTSIAGIRRFAITRLKIDRSFVTRVDSDRDQFDMVHAIQIMARQLGLQTIAEGVETVAEQATVTEIGCDAIQGFVLARPMPAEEVGAWLSAQNLKLGISGETVIGDRTDGDMPKGKTA